MKQTNEIILIPFQEDGRVFFRDKEYTSSAQAEHHHVVIRGRKFFIWSNCSPGFGHNFKYVFLANAEELTRTLSLRKPVSFKLEIDTEYAEEEVIIEFEGTEFRNAK